MERSTLSSMVVVSLEMEEMLNVRGGDGTTTVVITKPVLDEDIIL
jgi:hypothetical protein